MTQFKKGKQVQYMSGGPIMTMETQNPTTLTVTCGWFDDLEFKSAEFDPETLKDYVEYRPEPEDDEYDPYAGGRSRVTGY